MKFIFTAITLAFSLTACSTNKGDLSVLEEMHPRLQKMVEEMEKQNTPESMKKHMMLTGLMTVKYHTDNINQSCKDILIDKCGKEDTKGRIKCLADNRKVISNQRCVSNINEVYGELKSDKEVYYDGILIPKGSKISYSEDNKISSANLSEDITYRGITFEKGKSIIFHNPKKTKINKYFAISHGKPKSKTIIINDIEYNVPEHGISFNQYGNVQSAKLTKDTVIEGMNIPANSQVYWSSSNHLSYINLSKKIKVRGVVTDNIELNAKGDLVFDINKHIGKNETFRYDGILYANFICIDKNENVVIGTLAQDAVINGVKYDEYTYFRKDSSGKIIKHEKLKKPAPAIKVGNKYKAKNYHLKIKNGNYSFPSKHYKGEVVNQLISINDRSTIGGFPSRGLKVLDIIKLDDEFTVVEVINNRGSNSLYISDIIMKDSKGELYQVRAYNNKPLKSMYKCNQECQKWVDTLSYCINNNNGKNCQISITPHLKDDDGRLIFKRNAEATKKPSEKALERMHKPIIKYLENRNIEYTINDKIITAKVDLVTFGQLILDYGYLAIEKFY